MRLLIPSLTIILISLSFFPVIEFAVDSRSIIQVSAQSEEETNSTIVYPFDEYFLDYPGYDDINDMLFEQEAKYPDIMRVYDLTALTSFGKTHYDRTVWGVKISDGVYDESEWYDDPEEEDIVIVGNHHAREWMTIMVSLYFMYYLTEFYGEMEIDNDGDGLVDEDPIDGFDNDGDGEDNDDDISTRARMDGNDNDGDGLIDEGIDEDCVEGLATYLVNNREIWIIPLLNPDGYEYDRTISEPPGGGGWRKNQRDQSQMGGKRSSGNGQFDEDNDGVDLNRNYPYEWNRNEKGYIIDENGLIITMDSRQEGDGTYRGPDDDIDDDDDSFIGFDPISGNRIYDPDRVDEDYWNGYDDDGDGFIDEDKDGGFTEPETQVMEELMKKLDIYDENDTADYPQGYRPENHDRVSNAVISISYHSYSAKVIWPWGYTFEDPEHEPLLRYIGEEIIEITDYDSWKDQGGYKVSGSWGDWMYGSHGVLPYTLELNRQNQGGFHPLQKYIIPTVRMILGSNIYISRIAHKAKIAKETGAVDLELDFPEFLHEQKKKKIESDESYKVTLSVQNLTNLEPGSLKLWYRVDDGEWISRSLEDKGQGTFKGSIPGQESGSNVEYYFEGDDARGIRIHSQFGDGTPYRYSVKDGGFLVINWIDGLIMMAIVAFLFQGGRKSNRQTTRR